MPAKWKDKHKSKTIKFIPSIILYFCLSLKERVKPHKNESMLTLKAVKRINKIFISIYRYFVKSMPSKTHGVVNIYYEKKSLKVF